MDKRRFLSELMRCGVISIITLQLLQGRSQAAELTAKCIANSAREGDQGTVHCMFPMDVNVTGKEVNVQRYDGNFNFNDTVVECDRRNDANKFHCKTGKGYKLEGAVGQTLTMIIPVASSNFVGKYVCQILPANPQDMKPCEFHLIQSPNPPSVDNQANTGRSGQETNRSDVSINDSSSSSSNTVLALSLGLGIPLTVALAMIVIAAIWLLMRKRKKKSDTNSANTNDTATKNKSKPEAANEGKNTSERVAETCDDGKPNDPETVSERQKESAKCDKTTVTSENDDSKPLLATGRDDLMLRTVKNFKNYDDGEQPMNNLARSIDKLTAVMEPLVQQTRQLGINEAQKRDASFPEYKKERSDDMDTTPSFVNTKNEPLSSELQIHAQKRDASFPEYKKERSDDMDTTPSFVNTKNEPLSSELQIHECCRELLDKSNTEEEFCESARKHGTDKLVMEIIFQNQGKKSK